MQRRMNNVFVVNYSGVGARVSGGVEDSNKLREDLRRGERHGKRQGLWCCCDKKMLTSRCFCCDWVKTFLATIKNIFLISSSGTVRYCTRQLVKKPERIDVVEIHVDSMCR